MLERVTSPVHGFPHRIDYVLKRRKREQGMMEIAYATASHSSYWMSEDVIMFTIMQLCKPVVEKLHRYMSAQRPLPTLMRNIVELTPHAKVSLSSSARIRDRCTGFYNERIVVLDNERLYILPRIQEIVCKRKWSMKLTSQSKAVYGDDSFTLRVVPRDSPTAPKSPSRRPRSPAAHSESVLLKAQSTPVRDEWLSAINHSILKSGGGHPDAPLPPRHPKRSVLSVCNPVSHITASDLF
jgi:phospholipase DDHD1